MNSNLEEEKFKCSIIFETTKTGVVYIFGVKYLSTETGTRYK